MSNKRKAVILFNLGGPDTLDAVQPFLFNLFNDPAIIGLPNPFRYLLAKFISNQRAPFAKKIYSLMGGGSPIYQLTLDQAKALEDKLNNDNFGQYKVFVSMRYWHPFAEQVISEVHAYDPNEIILLPLYPQYSTSTTASSFKDWFAKMKARKLSYPTKVIGCYPTNEGFLNSYCDLIIEKYNEALKVGKPRILFSAHGLPKRRIKEGDPYQHQVIASVTEIVERLAIPELDYKITFQSKVGPLEWLKPATDEEIILACKDGVPMVIVPIAFVSEHSETLVELDIEYKHLAEQHHTVGYLRVETVSTNPKFINGLADLCLKANFDKYYTDYVQRCPIEFGKCACRNSRVI